jgi:hypothetical protein
MQKIMQSADCMTINAACRGLPPAVPRHAITCGRISAVDQLRLRLTPKRLRRNKMLHSFNGLPICPRV